MFVCRTPYYTTATPEPSATSPAADPADPDRRGYPPNDPTAPRQDWAHVRVRPGAHLFWWLYETTATPATPAPPPPLAVWLQGGPGASATGFGNFAEIGPLWPNGTHRTPGAAWTAHMDVLFVDAPVGAGFSYAERAAAFSRSDAQCARDLVQLMRGFYARRPEYRGRPAGARALAGGGAICGGRALRAGRRWG